MPTERRSHPHLPKYVCMVVMKDDSSSRDICRNPSRTSTSEKHLAWQSLWSCSVSVGIWSGGWRIALLTVES